MPVEQKRIREIILNAAQKATEETAVLPAPEVETKLDWPIQCTLGPGLEGAIACETEVGYVCQWCQRMAGLQRVRHFRPMRPFNI
jgi:hypothetical protein